MKLSETLKAARAKIEKPENWARETFARDCNNRSIEPSDPAAVCFCSIGAIKAVCPGQVGYYPARTALAYVTGGDVIMFNDGYHTTHADVLAAFDRAIAQAEASEK